MGEVVVTKVVCIQSCKDAFERTARGADMEPVRVAVQITVLVLTVVFVQMQLLERLAENGARQAPVHAVVLLQRLCFERVQLQSKQPVTHEKK